MWLRIIVIGLTTSATLNWSNKLIAQRDNLQFEHISIEHGLSQNTVYCIFQDSKGFIWVGTQDGLNKYDGYTFQVYKHDPENLNSLSNDVITAIHEDESGVLWIGTHGGGLNKFDPASGTFKYYKNDPNDRNSLSNDYVLFIRQGRSGHIWIATKNGGLNRFDPQTNVFIRYGTGSGESSGLSNNDVRSVHEDRSGVLWIGTNGGGLTRLVLPAPLDKNSPGHVPMPSGSQSEGADGAKATFTHYKSKSDNPNGNRITTIYEDQSGSLWLGGGSGLLKFDREEEVFTVYKNDPSDPKSLSNNTIWSIHEDQSGVLWIGTGNGLNKLVPGEGEGSNRAKVTFTRYKHDPDMPNSLSDNYIRSICEDRSGILWIGTWNGGLNMFDPKRQKFAHYTHDPDEPKSLSHINVRSIYEDRSGVLWVGTRGGGLNKRVPQGSDKSDHKRAIFIHYQNDPNNPKSLSHNYVWSIFEDRSGALWIGTYGHGLNKFDQTNETFTRYDHILGNPKSLSHYNVTPIYEDRSGVLWIGTDGGGLNRLIPGSSAELPPTFIHYKNDPSKPNSLSHDGVWSIFEDRSGALWIGTDGGGLNRLDPKRETFTRYKNDPNNPNSLSNDHIFSIYEDQTGVFWIGTWGGGLNKLVLNTDSSATGLGREILKFTHYGEKDGLPNDAVYGILEDHNGNLWLSTNKGLTTFNPETETLKSYDVGDGLQSNEFNANAYFKSRSEEMFFGGINGFNAFHPDQVRDNPYSPPIVITTIKTFDETVRRNISGTDELELSYKDKYVTFEFVALDYTNPEKNQYAFMLEGFDEGWKYSNTRRFANYTNLDAGEYVFRVKGSNNDGVWNEEGVSVKISITPAPWKTWWAYTLYVLVIGAIIYGLRRNELNRMQLKNRLQLEKLETEKLKELDHLKSRFFANISHEFRTPLTLILGPIENAISKISNQSIHGQLRTAFENGRRMLRLINQLLDLSKLEAGGMVLRASSGNLISFLKGIVFTFESLAKQKQITLEFRTNYAHLETYYDIEKLEQVFYNLMSNAIKFTPTNSAGKITVTVRKTQATFLSKLPPNIECVQVTVKDTGIGIPGERLPHIFDRFYQVNSSQTREREGSGIGLALANEMIELHYGLITVKSEEGKGTKFVVTLPLGNDHLKPEEIEERGIKSKEWELMHKEPNIKFDRPSQVTTDDEQRALGNETIILIVEDNQEVRAFIRQHMEPDYQVMEAADGQDGFEKAAEAIPDLIISDVMMPKMDGYEFCHTIKTDEKTSHIPVIMLTARADQESKLEGLETGADDYLSKPFSSKELLVRVKNLIEQRRKLQERFSREVVLKPADIAITSIDEQFLHRVKEVVEKYLGDEDFSVADLASEVALSRVQLHRKLKALTGQSSGEFVLSLRLQRAVDLLKHNAGTVSEIAYMTGFNTPNYFAKCFRKQFGCSPSEYKMNMSGIHSQNLKPNDQ